jgi:N-methylhydantoinase B
MPSRQAPFDAATLEVLWNRLISVVDEAAAALVRTSFSTVVRESYDFTCVLTDRHGESVAQATDANPGFISTLPNTVRHFLAEYPPERLAPGDVLITNDPWLATGHLPDITVAKPLFLAGRLVAFAASAAHTSDIGGKMRSAEPREIFEEGFQIPILKLMEAGAPNESLLRLLRQNVRTPDLTLGDLWAQVTALDLMERRLLELMRGYGLPALDALAGEIQRRSERAMRAAIRALPDGTCRSAMETDGLDEPLTLAVAVTVKGEGLSVDFAGTSPQVGRAINVPLSYTRAYSAYAAKCLAAPHVPNNGGALRPLTVTAPQGCILNPAYPAAVGARTVTGQYISTLVLSAFAELAPERVMAAAGSPIWAITQSGIDGGGRPFSHLFMFNGGMGAAGRRDGPNCLAWPSNISATPIEVIERAAPLRVRYRRFRPGSGGAGRFRGGLGQEVLLENLAERPAAVSFLAERTRVPAPGLTGGAPGATGEIRINGEPVDPKRQHIVARGDTVLMKTPGGGGCGPAAQRPPEALERDGALGYMSDGG